MANLNEVVSSRDREESGLKRPVRTRSEWEQDLVMRHRYGEEEAFEELYAEFSSLVFSLTLRMSGCRQQAQDLTQEVFLRIYKSLAKFRCKSSLKTWIYKITLNHCRSRLGRKKLPMDSLDEEGAPNPVDPGRGPESLAMAVDTRGAVLLALERVDVVYREAVVLRDIEELSYEEIGSVLKVRVGTVRSRLSRGRAQLKAALDQLQVEQDVRSPAVQDVPEKPEG